MTDISQAGTKIASGSDDLNIIVWEWERGRYDIFKQLFEQLANAKLGDFDAFCEKVENWSDEARFD